MSQSKNNNKQESPQGIAKIAVSGFKSLVEECSIDVHLLTILAGANSSGKSSIMQPLLLMKQTIEAPYDPGPLLLNGVHVKFTKTAQLLSKISKDKYIKNLVIGLQIYNFNDYKFLFSQSNDRGFGLNLLEMNFKNQRREIKYKLDMTTEEIRKCIGDIDNIANKLDMATVRDRCFLLFESKDSMSYRVKSYSYLAEYISRLIHVPALRGLPERNYPITGIGDKFLGTFDKYTASIVHNWSISENNKLEELEKYLTLLGLTNKVDAERIDDTQVEIRVGRISKNTDDLTDMVNIADVGFGVSQTLPVLVALLVAKPDQLVYIEQPEIHLHPRAQAALGDILADAANRGVRIVVETHSDLLIRRLQSLVAEDKIATDKVILHWFSRDEKGFTKITSAELDNAGAFGDWPEDFSEVDLAEESRYLDAAEAKLM